MLMRALKPWYNSDYEGSVAPGMEFEASDWRAKELQFAGLAVPCLSDTKKLVIDIQADTEILGRRRRA